MMKEQYLNQVRKALHLPRRQREEVLRDLEEAFEAAAAHGEPESQVIARLGDPAAFARSAQEQLGFDPAADRRRKRTLGAVCLAAGAVFFALFMTVQERRTPSWSIGGADGPTSIFVAGTLIAGPDPALSILFLALALTAILAGVLLLVKSRKA